MSRAPAPFASVLWATTLLVSAVVGLAAEPILVDVTSRTGIDFVHENGMTGELYFPEMTGPGGALLDYDRDGDLDLYLVQGGPLDPEARKAEPLPTDRLYRNELVPSGVLRFTDVTSSMGLDANGYGMGVATGDFDNDGWVDLYLTNYGGNQLWRNVAGTFLEDVSESAGVAGNAWSTGATFVDYDRDGWLDLYVVDYVGFSVERNPRCFSPSSRRDYCGPTVSPASPDHLYRNLGNGVFREISLGGAGIEVRGPGLGVVALDANGDDWLDLFVANDGAANLLWINQHDGTFRDEALLSGVAFNLRGEAEASMGVDAADLDRDGDEEIFVAHLAGETNTLYVNLGDGLFEDGTLQAGLGAPSLPFTGFGASFTDLDLDGRLDLVIVNGAVKIDERQLADGEPLPLQQANQIFKGTVSGYEKAVAGDAFEAAGVSRGLAVGDVDNDGDADLLITHNAAAPSLLLNRAGDHKPWIGVSLHEVNGRPSLGAWVALRRSAKPRWQRVRTDGSYASARDPRLVFARESEESGSFLEVLWPDGRRSRHETPPAGRYTAITAPDAGAESISVGEP